MKEQLKLYEDKMEKTLNNLLEEYAGIRAGRANPHVLDKIKVDYYGSPTPINQLAGISVQEGRIIVIKPYDKSVLKGIEHAINTSNLNLPPQSDGTVIRLTVPALTGETRKALCKDVKKMAENAKVAVRNIRREANDDAKKEDSFTEDQQKQCQEKIQKLTDDMIKKIDEVAAAKENDIMTV